MIATFILAAAFAQTAKITDLNGNPPPAEIPAGEVVFFSAKQSERGEKNVPLWLIEPPERRARAAKFDGGLTLCVPAGVDDCVLKVTLVVAKADAAAIESVTVRIVGRGPKPPPKPPGPDNPPGPPPLSDVGKVSHDEAMKIPTAARSKAKAVGTALRSAQQAVMDNAMSQPGPVLSLVRSKTNAVLESDASAWSAWGTAVALQFKAANPTTPAAWARLLEQAAEGVEVAE